MCSNVLLETREERGKAIALNDFSPQVLQANAFVVPSQFGNGSYRVLKHFHGWTCTCPDFRKRRESCKHIFAIQFWQEFKAVANRQGLYSEINNMASCIYCNSQNVVKNGKRQNAFTVKQRFLCRGCGKFFVLNQEFARLKGDEKTITLCLDLYFKGLSLKKIVDTLQQFHSLTVHYSTVYRWIERFMKIINEYVAQHYPEQVGDTFHTDETKVKTKEDWYWVWNTIDAETKFLMASTITKTRFIKDVKKHFLEVKAQARQKPKFIHTDGLQGYRGGFNKVFYSSKQECRRIRSIGFKKNQPIERLHSSQKERLKVMRGVNHRKALNSKMESWKTYYNFVREHQAIGTTPAQKAGINLDLKENRWLSLVEKSKY